MESTVKHLAGNGVAIRERITRSTGRRNYERAFKRLHPLPKEMKGKYHASHAIGSGWGTEHKAGIFYAPAEVNLKFQNAGIEDRIRELCKNLDETKAELWTVTEITPVSSNDYRLKEITYQFILLDKKTSKESRLFELTLNVDYNTFKEPRVNVELTPLCSTDLLAVLLNV